MSNHPLAVALRDLVMPQRELARRTKINHMTVSLVVCGKRTGFSPGTAAEILRVLRAEGAKQRKPVNLSLAELLTLTPTQRRANGG